MRQAEKAIRELADRLSSRIIIEFSGQWRVTVVNWHVHFSQGRHCPMSTTGPTLKEAYQKLLAMELGGRLGAGERCTAHCPFFAGSKD